MADAPVGDLHLRVAHEGGQPHGLRRFVDGEQDHRVASLKFFRPSVRADEQDVIDIRVAHDVLSRFRQTAAKLHLLQLRFFLFGERAGRRLRRGRHLGRCFDHRRRCSRRLRRGARLGVHLAVKIAEDQKYREQNNEDHRRDHNNDRASNVLFLLFRLFRMLVFGSGLQMTAAFCVVVHICPPVTVGIIACILSYPRSICNGFPTLKQNPLPPGLRLKGLRLAAAHSSSARVRAKKHLRRTCRRRKWLKLYLRLRAQTLRDFFDVPAKKAGQTPPSLSEMVQFFSTS